jgi:hypothetical protein
MQGEAEKAAPNVIRTELQKRNERLISVEHPRGEDETLNWF